MRFLKKVTFVLLKASLSVVLIALLAFIATGVSPVYRFSEPAPFEGPNIFNPYRDFDKSIGWKRANLHTHTKIDGILNECDYTPEQTLQAFEKFDYDIVTFSNHNLITQHPLDPALQVNLYEHGYNLLKYHKLVFGSAEESRFDHLLPIFTFQKQFQLDYLRESSDIIVINHPLRTPTLSDNQMAKLEGYHIVELDSGKSTENRYWDAALSAGHYSFGVANDDLHYPNRSGAIARRCNFICTPSAHYEDLRDALLGGCYYSMRLPDYGKGNWQIKIEKNRQIPQVRDIGEKDGAIYLSLSQPADSIKITGQNGRTLAFKIATDSLGYQMLPHDSYGRFTAYFPEGEVIYSNPFARYDAEVSQSPVCTDSHSINIVLTILYNLLLLGLFGSICAILYKIIFVW